MYENCVIGRGEGEQGGRREERGGGERAEAFDREQLFGPQADINKDMLYVCVYAEREE